MIVLSMHDERLYAERALRAGARGYIMKRETAKKVIAAIRQVLDGKNLHERKPGGDCSRKNSWMAGCRPAARWWNN